MMQQLGPDPILEVQPLVDGQRVRFRNDRNDIDDLAQFLHDNHVDRTEAVASRVDEEKTAVDSGILDVSVSLGGEFLSEVGRVLVLVECKFSVLVTLSNLEMAGTEFRCAP